MEGALLSEVGSADWGLDVTPVFILRITALINCGIFTLAGEDSQPHMNVGHFSIHSVQFISVTQSCPTLCNPMNRSVPGLPVHHQLLEFTQTHVH